MLLGGHRFGEGRFYADVGVPLLEGRRVSTSQPIELLFAKPGAALRHRNAVTFRPCRRCSAGYDSAVLPDAQLVGTGLRDGYQLADVVNVPHAT
jgi:hypothetical protein